MDLAVVSLASLKIDPCSVTYFVEINNFYFDLGELNNDTLYSNLKKLLGISLGCLILVRFSAFCVDVA